MFAKSKVHLTPVMNLSVEQIRFHDLTTQYDVIIRCNNLNVTWLDWTNNESKIDEFHIWLFDQF